LHGQGGHSFDGLDGLRFITHATFDVSNIHLFKKGFNRAMTALIAKWGLDQIINTAVSVNLGNATIQFTKQPNGSYTPQANCTMTLILTNGAYWLEERHGRTFEFSTNNVLSSIVDQYGQSLALTYNSSNRVSTVTDWKGRSLTFTYSGPNLTSVADSTGRSVSYGYTSGDLTSFTDAQSGTSSYTYDTNNQIIATFDALTRLVITNFYDAYGHITTQLTLGNTNEIWQVYPSDYATVEVDPAGDQRQFTFDSKSRQTAFQDALGNITQTIYDGQDHVVQTVSPLNETNQFIYDGSNNLVETIDPLGYSNVFTYDANNNLIASTDGRGNTSYFGYNAQFSLTDSTNGNGDWTVFTYNSDVRAQPKRIAQTDRIAVSKLVEVQTTLEPAGVWIDEPADVRIVISGPHVEQAIWVGLDAFLPTRRGFAAATRFIMSRMRLQRKVVVGFWRGCLTGF
jgi:YD repeat-containing protein